MDFNFNEVNTMGITDAETYGEIMKKEFVKCREIAKTSIENAQVKYKKRHDTKHKHVDFKMDDMILVFKPVSKTGLSKKLSHRWNGPYKIIAKLGPTTYKILNLQGRKNEELVHVSRMKLYKHRDVTDITHMEDNSRPNDEILEEIIDVENDFSDEITEFPLSYEISNPYVDSAINSETMQNDQQSVQNQNETINETDMSSSSNYQPRRNRRNRAFSSRFRDYFLLFLCLLAVCNCQFHEVPPVVWRKSKNPVVIGSQNVEWTIRYVSPCELFDQFKILPILQRKQMKDWCDNTFKQNFKDIVNKFCKRHYHDQKKTIINRRKRFVIIGSIILVAVFGLTVTAIGIGSAALSRSMKNTNEIDLLKVEKDKILDSLEMQVKENLKIKNVLQKLNERLISFEENFNNLKHKFENFEQHVPDAIRVLSSLVTQFATSKETLQDISRKWKKQQISDKLFDYFNITLNCDGLCPVERGIASECKHDEHENLIKF